MAADTDFGRDVSCGASGLRTGRLARGTTLLAEAIYRRLTTPRGTLRGGDEEGIYGEDLTAYVGRNDRGLEFALPGIIRTELLKDERIFEVTSTVVRTVNGPAVSFTITIDCVSAAGPFSLKLAVSEVSTTLLGIS
jgi:hypothetical protein